MVGASCHVVRHLVFPDEPQSSGLTLSAPKRDGTLPPYRHSGGDAYWKIGVGAPDVAGLQKWCVCACIVFLRKSSILASLTILG